MYIKTDENSNIVQFTSVGEMPDKPNYFAISDDTSEEILRRIFDYRFIDGNFVLRENACSERLERVKKAKINALSKLCHDEIVKGFDCNGEHYSLSETDQLNLQRLAIQAEKGGITCYHCDGGLNRNYTPEEMIFLANTASNFIEYHMDYFNRLKSQIKSMTDIDEAVRVKYGEVEDLTDYKEFIYDISGEVQYENMA